MASIEILFGNLLDDLYGNGAMRNLTDTLSYEHKDVLYEHVRRCIHNDAFNQIWQRVELNILKTIGRDRWSTIESLKQYEYETKIPRRS